MIPWPRLNTAAVVNVQPPHSTRPARARSVRERRSVHARPATSSSPHAGSSQEACAPKSALNILVRPGMPQRLVVAPTGDPPPTLPVSLPVRRPKPL